MIEEINRNDLICALKQLWGFNSSDPDIDDTLIASCVRRQAGFQCPCSAKTLVSSTVQAFHHLITTSIDKFTFYVEQIVERLIIGGDLLELSEVATNGLDVQATWLFPAHPSYLPRASGSHLIFGIVPDEFTPIASLADRIVYRGCQRYITQKQGEDLGRTLTDLGLTKISESAWLKLPNVSTASEYLLSIDNKLSDASPSGEIEGLTIIDTNKSNLYYRRRWTSPTTEAGRFIGKRPHLFGGYIWCYVELKEGRLRKFVDLPFKYNNVHQRGCDGAWHLQMAIDYCIGRPQQYNIKSSDDGDIFEFFSPIPLWAERRLVALGETVAPIDCLFSYLIPKSESLFEENFLNNNLWLSRKQ